MPRFFSRRFEMTWIFFGWMFFRLVGITTITTTIPTTDPGTSWTQDGGTGQPPQGLDGGTGQPPKQLDGGTGQPPSRL
jgi:hypothetical protein